MGTARVAAGARFRDPSVRLWEFADDILVCCPACAGPAVVRPDPAAGHARLHRRLACPGCGHTASWAAPREGNAWVVPHLSGPEEPFFGLPLWLRTGCRGGRVLWACNAAHLALLESYVAAGLRERGPVNSCSMSLVEELPAWMKAAKHRGDLLRGLRRLRARLP